MLKSTLHLIRLKFPIFLALSALLPGVKLQKPKAWKTKTNLQNSYGNSKTFLLLFKHRSCQVFTKVFSYNIKQFLFHETCNTFLDSIIHFFVLLFVTWCEDLTHGRGTYMNEVCSYKIFLLFGYIFSCMWHTFGSNFGYRYNSWCNLHEVVQKVYRTTWPGCNWSLEVCHNFVCHEDT